MTREYARLSLKAGYLARLADMQLGGDAFAQELRRHAWKLSDEYLDRLKQRMIAAGVPAEVLDLERCPELQRALADEGFIDTALDMQKKFDNACDQ